MPRRDTGTSRRRSAALGALLALVVAACSGGTANETSDTESGNASDEGVVSTTTTTPTTTTTAAPMTTITTITEAEPKPHYVEVNGANLAYECMGSGSPAVIFEHGNPPPGFEEYDPEWGGARVTIEAIAEFTRSCIYGRRGFMGSDPVTVASRTAAEQVADLGEFVETIGVETPIVLIGYSWGGELARLFAGENPGAVSGLVLVDSRHPDNDAALGVEPSPPQPPEMIDFPTSESQVAAVTDLGDLPIAILTSGEPFPGAPEEVFEIWWDLQEDLASLSTDTTSATIEHASHFTIPSSAVEIAGAVRDVIERSRA